jgi:hypothetical protein
MELTLTTDLLKELVAQGTFNEKFATTIAHAILEAKDPVALARYILSHEVAIGLLTERLVSDPEGTVQELAALPDRNVFVHSSPNGKRRGRPPKGATVTKAVGRPRGRPRKNGFAVAEVDDSAMGKRVRLDDKQLSKMKERIREYLKDHPESCKKDIIKAAKVPTAAIYNRLMAELKEAKELAVKGDKRSAVYSLR